MLVYENYVCHGHSTHISSNNDIFTGIFYNNKCHGFGQLITNKYILTGT